MQENLHVTVAAVVEHDKRFLMVKEDVEGQIVYNQPAGHLEENETLIEAVIRECLEETAWHFNPLFVTGIYQWTQTLNRQTFLRVGFYGEHTRHESDRELDSGIIEAVWLTRDELDEQKDNLRSPLVMRCIDDFRAGHRYPLQLLSHIT